jgi:hypothetical protein
VRLSDQTRINITSWAEEYIADLVANYDGDGDDVRRVIVDLQDQVRLGGYDNASERSSRAIPDVAPSPFQWQGEVSSP